MRINLHAGHAPDGGVGCGAVGIGFESTMNRDVVRYLHEILTAAGHTVRICTCEDNVSSSEVLKRIVDMCNKEPADLDISIHHNATAVNLKDMDGDGRVKGVETYVYGFSSKAYDTAVQIAKNISKLGYPYRGVFEHPELYVLRKTKSPAILVECCFVDDKDDMAIWDPFKIAWQIAAAIDPESASSSEVPISPVTDHFYKVQIGAFIKKGNAEALLQEIKNAGYEDAFIQTF